MIGIFNTISIEEVEIFRGNNFSLEREWIYAAEIETCTGKRCADVVGWRYKDLTISWDNLPQDQLQTILDLDGSEVNMTFTNEQNQSVTEANVAWSGIGLQVRFINAHN